MDLEPETLRLLSDAYDRASDAAAQTNSWPCKDSIECALRNLRRAMVEALGDEL